MCMYAGFTASILCVTLAYRTPSFNAFKQLLSAVMHNLELHLQVQQEIPDHPCINPPKQSHQVEK